MGYERINDVLEAWAGRHALHLFKRYKGSEVRSVEIVSIAGERYQIWIDKPDMNGLIGIHIWDFKRRGRRADFLVSIVDLNEYLENARDIAMAWSVA
jgi:hypothetical protein